jgi:hypothetical protein
VCQGNKKILKQIFGGRNNGKQPFIDILTFSAKKRVFLFYLASPCNQIAKQPSCVCLNGK